MNYLINKMTLITNFFQNKNPSLTNIKEGFLFCIQLIFHTFCSTSVLFSFLFLLKLSLGLHYPQGKGGESSKFLAFPFHGASK